MTWLFVCVQSYVFRRKSAADFSTLFVSLKLLRLRTPLTGLVPGVTAEH